MGPHVGESLQQAQATVASQPYLYQASNIGYVWRRVAHGLIFLHLLRKDTDPSVLWKSDDTCTTALLLKRRDKRSRSQNPGLTLFFQCANRQVTH